MNAFAASLSRARTAAGMWPRPVRAALYAFAAAAGFAVMVALIRQLTGSLHPFQVAFFRNFFALLFTLPWLFGVGLGVLRTRQLPLYLLRGVISLGSMLLWFTGIAMLPLDQAVALSFTAPLFTTVLAALALKETVGWRRWLATLAGFGGALVVMRPGDMAFDLGTLVVLASALLTAVAIVIVKELVRREPPGTVVAYMTLVLAPMSLPFAWPVWAWPDAAGWAVAIAIGACASLAHLLFARALALADASFIMAFDFGRLPIVAAIAYFAFAEQPDLLTFVGAAIIAVASVFLMRGEVSPAPPRR